MSLPLEGVKVVEMGSFVSIPVIARMMADWGAEVIKVEPLQAEPYRKITRIWNMPVEDDFNPCYQPMNANKRSIAINLKEDEGCQVMHKLLESADVFLTNMRARPLAKLGFDYESLKDRYPKLIYATLSGFGEKGPDKDRPGFDISSFWARSGALMHWAIKEGIPTKPHNNFGDTATASSLLAGVLAALYQRECTGKGNHVQSALYATGMWYNATGIIMAQEQFGKKYPAGRYEPSDPTAPPYQTKDGSWFLLIEPRWFAKYQEILTFLGLDEYVDDSRFSDVQKMYPYASEIVPLFEKAFKEFTIQELAEFFTSIDSPYEVITNPADVPKDPQALENGFLHELIMPNGKTIVVPNNPVQFDSVDQIRYDVAPNLGAHTKEILKELGYSDNSIQAMCENDIVKAY